jgi:hypothetical protein
MMASPSCLCCLATLWDLFRFLLVFPHSPLGLSAFFFPVFLLEKFTKRSKPQQEAGTRKANVTKCKIFKTGRL